MLLLITSNLCDVNLYSLESTSNAIRHNYRSVMERFSNTASGYREYDYNAVVQ